MQIKAKTIEEDEKYLRQISKPVDLNDKELKNDISILEQFCQGNGVLAMAAVQLGIPKRLIYIKNTNLDIVNKLQTNEATANDQNYNESRVLINPVIIEKIGLTNYWEACKSCLDFMGLVKRPYKILVEYFDVEGNKHKEIFEGFESTVLSHEMDHLDGILHMDIADEVLVMPQEKRKIFRQTHPYNIISKTGQYQDLIQSDYEKEGNKVVSRKIMKKNH